jgi:hypothetical protein
MAGYLLSLRDDEARRPCPLLGCRLGRGVVPDEVGPDGRVAGESAAVGLGDPAQRAAVDGAAAPDTGEERAAFRLDGREILGPMTWTQLPRGAKAFRIAHLVWGVLGMAALAYIWQSAIRRRRDPVLAASIAFLSIEGAALIVGRGDCPFGPFQSRLGDPVPMFELFLPPRAAKAAIPILAGVSLAGFVAVAIRAPRREVG